MNVKGCTEFSAFSHQISVESRSSCPLRRDKEYGLGPMVSVFSAAVYRHSPHHFALASCAKQILQKLHKACLKDRKKYQELVGKTKLGEGRRFGKE